MKNYDKESELVLVFRTSLLTELGYFTGININYEKYIDKIIGEKLYFFLSRKEVEDNPDFKQLIPYVIIMYRDKILYYVRGKGSGEKRLNLSGSIGIGGHINYFDFNLFQTDKDAYISAMKREVFEEIEINSTFDSKIVGVLNDDSNEVGKVHFGVIHLLKLHSNKVSKKEKEITKITFKSISEIEKEFDILETWSKLCVKNIHSLINL